MWRLLSFRLFSMVRPLQTADASGRRTYKIAGIFKEDDLQGIRRFQGYAETLFEVGLQVDDRHIWWFHSNHEMWILKAFVKGVRGYFSYYLRRFSLCFCLNNAFQSVLSSQTATMVKKHFDFIICFALLNHKNSIRFVFLRMVIWGG